MALYHYCIAVSVPSGFKYCSGDVSMPRIKTSDDYGTLLESLSEECGKPKTEFVVINLNLLHDEEAP